MTDSIWRLRHRDILCVCVLSLLCLGTLMVQSATMRVSGNLKWHWSSDGSKQLVFAGLAILTYLIVGRLDYRRLLPVPIASDPDHWGWLANPIFWTTLIAGGCCAAVLVPHIGMQINGARRWIKLGPVQLQPSELAKWAVVLLLAYVLAERPIDVRKFFTGFVPLLIPVGALCLLVVIQDFGTAALIATCALAMLMAGRAKWWHLALIVPPALLAGFWFVHHTPYRWRRMTAFMDPYASPDKEGYHMIQSLLSFSTGGVLGKGLGNGIQKLGYLPEDTTDFIFAVICEELGLFGAVFTAAMYLGIVFVGWQVVRQGRDAFGRMLAFGVAAMISLQAAINMAVATVSVPTKGLSLPLVSAGGTGLLITAAALGLLSSTARTQADEPETDESDAAAATAEAISDAPPLSALPAAA